MKTINRTDLQALLDGAATFNLLDVMPEEVFKAAHLPGAKNACVYEVNFIEQAAAACPDKGAAVVTYGSSPHSVASSTAAEKLERAGYSNVRDYRGGLEDWAAAGLPVEEGPEPPPHGKPADGRHEVDIEKSNVSWTGRNINGAHRGTIRLKSGSVDVAGGKASGGEFVLDMSSLENTDLPDPALREALAAHLKSDDFFDTAIFPIATFRLRHITINPHARPGAINADVDGSLTLKGLTEDLAFPALIEVLPGGALGAEAHFDIDRTRWNVIYGSGKFYEKLGKHLVHDLISIGLHIVTR